MNVSLVQIIANPDDVKKYCGLTQKLITMWSYCLDSHFCSTITKLTRLKVTFYEFGRKITPRIYNKICKVALVCFPFYEVKYGYFEPSLSTLKVVQSS